MNKFLLIDANIWIDLSNNPKNFLQLSSLSKLVLSGKFKLLIPESIKIEFQRNDKQKPESFKQKYQKELGSAYITFKNIFENQENAISELNQLKRKAEKTLGGLGSSLPTNRDIVNKLFQNAEHAPTSHLMSEAANRCLNHFPPASSERSSVGDCLIWLSILEYLDRGDIYFCTRNENDFAQKNRKDQLNEILQAEAGLKNFSLHFFNDLNKLIQSLLPPLEALPPFIASSFPQLVCPVCHSDNYEIFYQQEMGGMNQIGVCSDCNYKWRIIFESIPE